jgi:flagellar M-ring protein FliF
MACSSVPGLQPDKITIVDQDGKILNDPLMNNMMGDAGIEGEGGYTNEQILHRKEIEKDLKKKIAEGLDKFVGSSRYSVNVSVDMDFSQTEKSAKT